MAIHVPSSQLPELYLPDWASINQKLAQTRQTTSQANMLEAKEQREIAKENALAQYMKTGDRNALLAADPATALALDKEERANKLGDATLKAKEQELLLSRMQYIQTVLPKLTKDTYPFFYNQAKQVIPGLELPEPGTEDVEKVTKQGELAIELLKAKLEGREASTERITERSGGGGSRKSTTKTSATTTEPEAVYTKASTSAGAEANVQASEGAQATKLLSGKPPGRYRINGVEYKWTGTGFK